MYLTTLLSSLSLLALASAQGHGGVFGVTTIDSAPTDTAGAASAAQTSAVSNTTTSAGASAPTTVQGDSYCVQGLMCVSAVVNSSVVTYTLQAQGQTPGYMAMGFGTQMSNAQMVIMWANSDGSITLSQRTASGHVMPTVDANPARVATVEPSASVATGSQASFVYTIPPNTDTTQDIVWAFGDTNPGSADPTASIVQHYSSGSATLDLTKTISTGTGAGTVAPTSGSSSSSTASSSSGAPPFTPYQKYIVAHGVFTTIGFLVFLPFGVLLARYLRTTQITWFQGHWIVQVLLGGGAIFLGFLFAIIGVAKNTGDAHFDDPHKRIGLVIIILYILQCSLGSFIHSIKIGWANGRPAQNYIHAVLGLVIIGLAMYQIHNGFNYEWPMTMGRGPVAGGIKVVWVIWAIFLPVAYAGGMVFIKKQYSMERQAREEKHHKVEDFFGRPSGSVTGGEYRY